MTDTLVKEVREVAEEAGALLIGNKDPDVKEVPLRLLGIEMLEKADRAVARLEIRMNTNADRGRPFSWCRTIVRTRPPTTKGRIGCVHGAGGLHSAMLGNQSEGILTVWTIVRCGRRITVVDRCDRGG